MCGWFGYRRTPRQQLSKADWGDAVFGLSLAVSCTGYLQGWGDVDGFSRCSRKNRVEASVERTRLGSLRQP